MRFEVGLLLVFGFKKDKVEVWVLVRVDLFVMYTFSVLLGSLC